MSMNCSTPLRSEPMTSRVVKALFLSIILVAALVLNLKTFLVLLKRKHRNVVTIFLLNLTLVSALMASQIPFNIHAIIEQGWVFGNGFCQFNGFSNVFLCMDLIFTLVCLTIDRYLAVVKPLQHRTIMTRRTAYRMLVVVYFLSSLLAVIPILTNARYKYHPGTNHCSPSWSNSCAYGAAMTTIAFVLPCLGMLVTYTRIFLILKRKRVHMSKIATSTMSSSDMQNEDSNSLGNFEDTSTDPSGDDDIRLTAHKTLADAKNPNLEYDLQPGASLENSVEKDSAIQHTTTELTARKITRRSKEKLVKNVVGVCSSSGTDQESLGLQIREKDDTGTRLSSVDSAVNSLNMADKKPNCTRYMADIDKAYTVPECSVKGVVIPEINLQGTVSLDLPTTSTNNSDVFDREDTRTANNKQVSFQTPVSSSKTEVKQEGKRSSSIFPVSRSRKAINILVNRMKKQRAIRHEYKIARIGTILLVSFLVLWMPYVIAHLCFVGNCRTMTLYNVATFLVYTNALANPIIYALTNKAVMQDIRKSMGRLCGSR